MPQNFASCEKWLLTSMVISLFTYFLSVWLPLYFDLQKGLANIYALWLISLRDILNHGHSRIAKAVYLIMHTFDFATLLRFLPPRTNRLTRKTFLNNPDHTVIGGPLLIYLEQNICCFCNVATDHFCQENVILLFIEAWRLLPQLYMTVNFFLVLVL